MSGRGGEIPELGQPVVASVRRVGAADPRKDARRLSIRLAEAADMPACARVWEVSIADYERRLGRPILAVDLGPIERLIGHIRETDPQRFWVAVRSGGGAPNEGPETRPGREGSTGIDPAGGSGPAGGDPAGGDPGDEIVAFGSATIRGDVWFLSMLFVLPEEQASGLGRTLLERTLPGGRLPAPGVPWTGGPGVPSFLGTATDAAQPISNALYARYGMVPRLPVYRLTGRPERPERLPALPSGIRPVAFDEIAAGPPDGPGHRVLVEAVAAVDRTVLGYDRPADHRYLRREGRQGFLYLGPDGTPAGYGYTSAVGRVGPIAALDPALLAPISGHLLGAVEPRGANALSVPGAADVLFRSLLEAGFRLEGFPALLCWTEPFASFDRYVPISLALL